MAEKNRGRRYIDENTADDYDDDSSLSFVLYGREDVFFLLYFTCIGGVMASYSQRLEEKTVIQAQM